MYSFVSILSVAMISASAEPSPQNLLAPVATSVVAPAVVTAQSYQVISRNYNRLASPLRVAPVFANAAPLLSQPSALVAGSPIVAAEASPVVEARAATSQSSRKTEDNPSDLSRSTSRVSSKSTQAERTAFPSSADSEPVATKNVAVTPSVASAPAGVAVPAVRAAPVVAAGYNVYPAAYSAFSPSVSAVTTYGVSSPYFSSAYSTSNYVTYSG